jgi:TolB-like protein/Tfp pilus assembly protein PilF
MASEFKKEIELEIGHVLFIDIISYSKMLITEQSEQLQTLKQILRGTEQFRLAKAEGKLLGLPTGDGGALVFRTSPEAPVLCAIEISRELKRHPELRVRMGIHSGPVNEISDLNEQANIAGAGINIAQRVMDCGDAGHILLSQHVADDLEQYPRWRAHLHDLGECEVKHGVRVRTVNFYTDEVGNPEVPQKFKAVAAANRQSGSDSAAPIAKAKRVPWHEALIALLLLAALIAGFLFWPRNKLKTSTAAAPEKSIAVLPFANLSRDPDNAYFADGIQDEILTRLSKIADLRVTSRTSTEHYKSAPENLSEVGRQLSVAHVLEGSVQKAGDAVRVNVQLIKTANDSHVWADIYDRKLTDIFSVESDIAKAITGQLRAQLTGQEEKAITDKPTNNPGAYDAYLRGLAYTLKGATTAANSLAAQKYLREAVRLDPQFALAWALLSKVDALGYFTGSLEVTVALREEAREAAETALTFQPNLGEAILAKGYYHYACLKDYDTAVRYFEQARQLLPNSSKIPESLAYVARRRGEWDRSETYFNEAERLDPRNVNLLGQHALSYQSLRRFPEALRKLDQVLNITPEDVETVAQKAVIAQVEGDLPRASEILAAVGPNARMSELEPQSYQAILERRPAQIIPRLKEVLAKPDPALGFYNGYLRFLLGRAQELAGNHAAAQDSWREARSELEDFLKEQPENFKLIGVLATANAYLGDKAAAFKLVERAMAIVPIEKDAVEGPGSLEVLAEVAAQTGEHDRAIAALQKVLSIPGGTPLTPALLRLDPAWDPLRNDPRFQKLVASLAPKD